MEKKQTAVEWYANASHELIVKKNNGEITNTDFLIMHHNLFYEAQKMEKDQMKEATLNNVTTNEGLRKIFENQFEQYYNETYYETIKPRLKAMEKETFEEFLEREGYDEGKTQEIWEDGARRGAEWQAKQMYSKDELADLIDATFQGRQDVADLFSELLENLKTK